MNMTAPVAVPATPIAPAPAILAAAHDLLEHLEQGQRVDAAMLRAAMETAFGASDASGAWDWKSAYDACEVATVLFLRKYGKAVLRKAATPAARLSVLEKIAALLPTHTRRSEESQALQQFSTPVPIGLRRADGGSAFPPPIVVLEPSAGTGLMAILAEIAGGSLILNELAETRGRSARLPLSGPGRHPLRCRPDRRSPRSCPRAFRRHHESALHSARERFRPCRRCWFSAHRLGAQPPRAGRAAGNDHRGECRSGTAGLARGLYPPAGARLCHVLRRDRRIGLRETRNDVSDAAHRDRQGTRKGSGTVPRLRQARHRTSLRCLVGSRARFHHGCRFRFPRFRNHRLLLLFERGEVF